MVFLPEDMWSGLIQTSYRNECSLFGIMITRKTIGGILQYGNDNAAGCDKNQVQGRSTGARPAGAGLAPFLLGSRKHAILPTVFFDIAGLLNINTFPICFMAGRIPMRSIWHGSRRISLPVVPHQSTPIGKASIPYTTTCFASGGLLRRYPAHLPTWPEHSGFIRRLPGRPHPQTYRFR